MRLVIQRVLSAEVRVGADVVGAIGPGLVVFAGVAAGDGPADVEWAASKIRDIRIFSDEAGRMNRSVVEAAGSVLVVSQFTLLGDVRKGRRPAFDGAEKPQAARATYDALVERLRSLGVSLATGRFQADMQVGLINDGPVTILADSRRVF